MCLAPCWLAGRPVPLHGLLLHILPEAVHSAEEDDLPAQRRVTFGVGFEEPPSLLEPENKFIGRTSPFDASQGAVRRGTPNDSPYQSPGGSLSTQRDKRLGIHSLRKGLFAHLFAFLLFFFGSEHLDVAAFFFFFPQMIQPDHM